MTTDKKHSDLQVGYHLGQQAIERAADEAQTRCAWEKRGIEKLSAPKMTCLETRRAFLTEKRSELQNLIRQAPPVDIASLKVMRNLYWVLAVVLVLASILFAHMALAPFGLGWETWGFSLAMGLVAAFWTDQLLEQCGTKRLIQTICIVSLAASLLGLLILALVRGDILALYLHTALTVDPGSEAGAGDGAKFYAGAVWKLQTLFALLCVAMELASGMAIHRARGLSLASYAAAEKARQTLPAIDEELMEISRELKALETAPDLFEARFMAEFYRGLADRARRLGLRYVSILSLAFVVWIGGSHADAQSLHVVVGLDLTRSMAAPGYDGKTDAAKNLDALEQLARQLPGGAWLTVLGITDKSFSRPYVLLDRELPSEHGPLQFVDQVEVARRRLDADVGRFRSIQPRYEHTDVFGVLRVTADLFERDSHRRKVLVLYSDLRHSAGGIDLETPATIPLAKMLARVKRQRLLANLQGIEIHVYGVHAAGKNALYWESLKAFWMAYFHECGASFRTFSLASGVPNFGEASGQAESAR